MRTGKLVVGLGVVVEEVLVPMDGTNLATNWGTGKVTDTGVVLVGAWLVVPRVVAGVVYTAVDCVVAAVVNSGGLRALVVQGGLGVVVEDM
jgi:hypothetical protein